MTLPVRLARRLAEQLGCSRAEAELYIRNGWVTVDGQVIELPQHRVSHERVELVEHAVKQAVEPATLLLHKPAGVAVGTSVEAEQHWSDDPSEQRLLQRHFLHLQPLAALEDAASGLVVLSQDARIIRQLTEDGDQIEHEYVVEVEGTIAPYGLFRLRQGLSYQGRALPPCKVSWQNETRLRFAIKAVRPGQLTAMCAEVGLVTRSIRRLRIGRIPIGKGPEGAMPPGQWRYLPPGERF